jgi:hypothetical protein
VKRLEESSNRITFLNSILLSKEMELDGLKSELSNFRIVNIEDLSTINDLPILPWSEINKFSQSAASNITDELELSAAKIDYIFGAQIIDDTYIINKKSESNFQDPEPSSYLPINFLLSSSDQMPQLENIPMNENSCSIEIQDEQRKFNHYFHDLICCLCSHTSLNEHDIDKLEIPQNYLKSFDSFLCQFDIDQDCIRMVKLFFFVLNQSQEISNYPESDTVSSPQDEEKSDKLHVVKSTNQQPKVCFAVQTDFDDFELDSKDEQISRLSSLIRELNDERTGALLVQLELQLHCDQHLVDLQETRDLLAETAHLLEEKNLELLRLRCELSHRNDDENIDGGYSEKEIESNENLALENSELTLQLQILKALRIKKLKVASQRVSN